jgi:hypothetical protein
MAKTEEQIKEEFLFIVENNKEMLEKVIASYNNFLAEYRKFLEKDYATLTIYEAIESAESYALEKDEEEGGTFYAELLTDWYDEQVLEWKNRLDGLKNDYMIESVPVIDPEDNVDWGDYVRPVIYDITDWGFLVVPDENHLVENDIKGLEHIVYTVEYYNFPIFSEEDFNKSEELQEYYKSYKRYETLLRENNITATDTWKFALNPDFTYDKWAGRKVTTPEDTLTLAQYLNQCLQRISNDIEEMLTSVAKSEQAHLYLKETYYDDNKAEQLFKTWIATKGY